MKNRKSFLVLPIIIMVIMLLSFSNCISPLFPGENPYGNDDNGITSNDIYEPDNSPSQATRIQDEVQLHHIFNENGVYDIDYVKFDAVEDGTYRINLFEIKGFEPEVTLYDVDGSTIIEMKNTGTYTGEYDWWGYDKYHNYSPDEKESIIFQPTVQGTYYVSVKDIYGAHGRGSYKIRVISIIDVGTTTITATSDPLNFEIDLQWGSISGVDGYYLYRTSIPQNISNPNYSDFTLIKTLSETTYSDSNIEPNKQYYYYVQGYIANNLGDPSNIDDATFDWTMFKPTSGLINASEGLINMIQISLESKINYTNIVRYELFRAENVADDPSTYTYINYFAGTDIIGTLITDTNIDATDPPTYYYYCVKVVIDINGTEYSSKYSFFDSGAAGVPISK
jgi:hypothetical protein